MESLLLLNGISCATAYVANKISCYNDDIATSSYLKSVRYSDFYREARTGDLLLFSSTSLLSLTRPLTETIWTHVGVLIVSENKKFFEWSSHCDNEEIPNTKGSYFNGTQFVSLDNLVAQNGTFFWCKVSMTDKQRRLVLDFANSVAYKYSFSSMIEFAAYFNGVSKYFSGYGAGLNCAHTVALTYYYAGVIEINKNISLFKPCDFVVDDLSRWLVDVSYPYMIIGYNFQDMFKIPSKKIKSIEKVQK